MWSIYNPETGDRLNKDLTFHFLEIPKYAKKPIAEMTKMERWLAYFANQLDDKEKEELSMSDTAIKSAMQAARIFLNNTEERRRYINREMAIMDYNSDQEKARAEGRAEGLLVAIHSLMAAQNLTAQEAMDILNLPEDTKKTLLPQI